MVKGDERAHAGGEDGVGEALVVVDSLLIDGSFAGGLDARPRDGVAVAAEIHLLHDGEVFGEAMVLVAGDVACLCAFYVAEGVAEGVPDGGAAAVDVPCAFDLVGGGGAAPEEAFWKGHRASGGGGLSKLRSKIEGV